MSDPIETYTRGNRKLEIYFDTEAENPREDESNVGTMICFHSKYNLGDKHEFKSAREAIEYSNEHFGKEILITLPLYLYDHSGITISTKPFSCPWDSGMVGFIYLTEEKLNEHRIHTRVIGDLIKLLEDEVKTYDQYLKGEVYGFKLFEDDEEIDSCWGFYGNYKESGLFDHAGWIIEDD